MVIGKIERNDYPRETFSYCFGKAGARIIGGNVAPLVNRDDLTEAAAEQVIAAAAQVYRTSLNQNSRVVRPVYHLMLSLPPHESLSDPQFSQLGDRYLAGLVLSSADRAVLENPDTFSQSVDQFLEQELSRYQYAQVLHTDRDHLHLHQIVGRANLLDGRAISTSYDFCRSQSVLRYLEAEFGLERLPCSWETHNIPERAMTEPFNPIQQSIDAALALQPTLAEFIQQLQQQGMMVQKRKGQLLLTIGEVSETTSLVELKCRGLQLPDRRKPQNQLEL